MVYNQIEEFGTYIQFYHQLEHLDGRPREHVQTLQILEFHCDLCQTGQIPAKFEACVLYK